jgi:HEAT repeat protein
MRRTHIVPLAALTLFLFADPPRAAEPDEAARDEKALVAAKVGTDGPALVEFFRKRAGSEATRARARELIKQLGDDSFDVREKASQELAALGRPALPALTDATKSPDAEVARRAADCVRQIENDAGPVLAAAALRRLAARKPAGAAEVLLDYLPAADGEEVAEQVRATLAALAVRDGKADPALVKALADAAPERRAAAGEALCRGGAKDQRDALVKLLADKDAGVRLRVALGLLAMKERAAVPALIDLARDLDRERAWEAEEALGRLAGEAAPADALDDSPAGRAKHRDAWLAWWKKEGDKVDLAKYDPAQASLGMLLTIIADNNGCHVYEYGRDGKVRWQIEKLNNAIDAQVLPGNRVLLAEYGDSRVTERDFKGNILWEKKFPDPPYAAQRLANGRTFVATQQRVFEIDRDGKELFTLKATSKAAHKFPDGRIALIGPDGTYRRYDATGKELSSARVGFNRGNTVGGALFLPNGHILVDDNDKLREYDAAGKKVWEVVVHQADTIQRLPGGTTLVATMVEGRLVEFDKSGKEVWEKKFEGRRPWLARRR